MWSVDLGEHEKTNRITPTYLMLQRSRENSLSSDLSGLRNSLSISTSVFGHSQEISWGNKGCTRNQCNSNLKVNSKHKSKRRITYIELVESFFKLLNIATIGGATSEPIYRQVLGSCHCLGALWGGQHHQSEWETQDVIHRFHLVPLHHIAAHLVTVQYQQVSAGHLRSTSHSRASSGGWYSTVPVLQSNHAHFSPTL